MRLDGLLWDWKRNMQSGKLKQGLWGEKRQREEPGFPYLLATRELCHQSFSFDKLSVSYRSLWQVHWSPLKLCSGRHLPPLHGRPSHRLLFLPPLVVDVDVTCREVCFQKYLFLITCSLGGDERWGTSMLAWVAEEKPCWMSNFCYYRSFLTKKNGPCIWSLHPAQALMLDCRLQCWKGMVKAAQLKWGLDSFKVFKATPWASQKPIS